MPKRLGKFEIPSKLTKIEEGATSTYAKFIAEPFEAGYGHTIGNSLRRFTERDCWVLCVESRIHKAPTDGGVDELTIAALKAALGLQGDERCATHALHATSNDHFGIANGDGVCSGGECLQTRAAEAVHGLPRNFDGVAGNEERHARHVAIVFAGLIGTAQDHIVDVGGVDAAARNDRFEHGGGKVVGANASERAAVATEGGAQRLNDPGLL